MRLVFHLAGQTGLLAVWGTSRVDMRHILALEDTIEASGFPVKVECDWIPPDDYEARTFRHRYWVMQQDHFEVLKRDA